MQGTNESVRAVQHHDSVEELGQEDMAEMTRCGNTTVIT